MPQSPLQQIRILEMEPWTIPVDSHPIGCPPLSYPALQKLCSPDVVASRHPPSVMTWQKQLSHYLYFFSFSFLFILDLLHRRKCRKVSHHKCHTVTQSHHMMSHDESHDRHGKIVHRPCSNCISSVENLTRTLSSFLCQSLNKEQLALFRLGV